MYTTATRGRLRPTMQTSQLHHQDEAYTVSNATRGFVGRQLGAVRLYASDCFEISLSARHQREFVII